MSKPTTSRPLMMDSLSTQGPGSPDTPEVPISGQDYRIEVTLTGTTPMLCHRWDSQAIRDKAGAAKGSEEKRSDRLESYVYRDERGQVGIPAANFKAALCAAGASLQDPRSPRKSARDLVKASIAVEPFVASLGKDTWDFIDERRVVVQRNGVSRRRPAFTEGWRATFIVNVLAAEYLNPEFIHGLVTRAGRFIGLGDYRPEFGRFRLDGFTVERGTAS